MTEKFIVSYENLEKDIILLSEKLSSCVKPNTDLVCISRGGLVVGGLLTYALNIKRVHCVCLQSYNSDSLYSNKEVECLTGFLPNAKSDRHYLFVDDVNDTGQTLQYVKDKCRELGLDNTYATVYNKCRKQTDNPDFWSDTIDSDCWIVFPWDNL